MYIDVSWEHIIIIKKIIDLRSQIFDSYALALIEIIRITYLDKHILSSAMN